VKSHPVEVIGCSGETQAALDGIELLFGSKRLLAAVGPVLPPGCECVELGADLAETLRVRLAERGERRTAVLASGDPLYCGIGGTLRRLAPEAEFRFHPAPTAFQELFARLGEPWERVRLFSLHGDSASFPWRDMLRSPLAAIYGDAKRSARAIAEELIACFPDATCRAAAAGCDLGLPEESVVRGTLGELAENSAADRSLSVLALLPGGMDAVPELPLGLGDDNYLHGKNMITHPEVRAIAASKLRPVPGVLWDLGAGSGSVGLEAAGLCPALELFAVERNPERFAELEANFRREGLKRAHAVCGEILDRVDELPDPDRVFVGGGGRELEPIIRKALERMKPNGILVASAVLAESVGTLCRIFPEFRSELLTVNLSRGVPLCGQTLFRAENPITVAVFRKEAAL